MQIGINEEESTANLSGTGKIENVPESVAKKFNFGAALFQLFWLLWYRQWKLLIIVFIINTACNTIAEKSSAGLILTLIIGLCIFIYLGKKGNSLAWMKIKYKSEDEFHKIQKRWVKALLIPFILGFLSALFLPLLINAKTTNNHAITLSVAAASDNKDARKADIIQFIISKKLPDSSLEKDGSTENVTQFIQNVFSKRVKSVNGNIIELSDGYVLAVNGRDGEAAQNGCNIDYQNLENNCTITVDINGLETGPNQVGTADNPSDRWRFILGSDRVLYIEDYLNMQQ